MVSAWSFIWKRIAGEDGDAPEGPQFQQAHAEPRLPAVIDVPRESGENAPPRETQARESAPRDTGPLDSIGQRNELLRVRFSQLADRLDDLKSLNDDFALLAEPLEAIFTELPQAKSRILETEALLARELENSQNVRREVDTLSSRLSAVSAELHNETARSQKMEDEHAQLSSAHEEVRLTLREKLGLLENAERQLALEIEKQQALAGDLAVQRAENHSTEQALLRAEASLQRETEQRSMFERESRRLQKVVEELTERQSSLQTQTAELAQQRERHLAEIASLDARLNDEQASHQKVVVDNEATIALLTSERSSMTLRLDAVTARLATTEQILGNVRAQFREKDEALRSADRRLKEMAAERVTLERRMEASRGDLAHVTAQAEESQRLQQELNDRCDMLNKALAAKDAALENAVNKSASLVDRLEALTRRHETDRLRQEAANRRLIEELEGERAERTLAQGALEIARENRAALQRQNETLKKAVRAGQAHPDDQVAETVRIEADGKDAHSSNVSFLPMSERKPD